MNKTKLIYLSFTVIILGFFLALRILHLHDAAGNDESMYYYLGKKVLEGGIPYKDYYEMKPPMLFFSYAFLVLISGYSVLGMHAMSILISVVTSYFIFLTLKFRTIKIYAILVCSIWLLMVSSPMLYGTFLMSEHIIYLLFSASIYLLLKINNKNKFPTISYFLAGVLVGAAILIKQTSGIFLIPLGYLIFQLEDRSRITKLFILGGVTMMIINLGILLLTSSFSQAIFWIFEYPYKYISSVELSQGLSNLAMFGSKILGEEILLSISLLLSIMLLFTPTKDGYTKFSKLFFIAGIISIFPGLRFYPQYWLMLAFSSVYLWYSVIGKKFVSLLLVFVCMVQIVIQFNLHAKIGNNENPYYKGQYLDKTKKFSQYINRIIKEEDSIAILGSAPQFYIYTQKSTKLTHVWPSFLSTSEDEILALQFDYLDQIEKIKPDYIVFSFAPLHWSIENSKKHMLFNELNKFVGLNYEKLAVMDLKSGEILTSTEVLYGSNKVNSYVLYKKY